MAISFWAKFVKTQTHYHNVCRWKIHLNYNLDKSGLLWKNMEKGDFIKPQFSYINRIAILGLGFRMIFQPIFLRP